MKTCECGHDDWFHYLDVIEATQPVYERGNDGVEIIIQTTKQQRGSCSQCLGCLQFREREGQEDGA